MHGVHNDGADDVGPFLTEPIGVSISVGFRHRIERKKIQSLVSSIDHDGNSFDEHSVQQFSISRNFA